MWKVDSAVLPCNNVIHQSLGEIIDLIHCYSQYELFLRESHCHGEDLPEDLAKAMI